MRSPAARPSQSPLRARFALSPIEGSRGCGVDRALEDSEEWNESRVQRPNVSPMEMKSQVNRQSSPRNQGCARGTDSPQAGLNISAVAKYPGPSEAAATPATALNPSYEWTPRRAGGLGGRASRRGRSAPPRESRRESSDDPGFGDVEHGEPDINVVQTVDRRGGSLPEFPRVLQRFWNTGAAFVSVTRSFAKNDTMGRRCVGEEAGVHH